MGKINVACDGIGCDEVISFDIPDWTGEADKEGEGHWLYCPKCAVQAKWFDSQCPGCVGSFSDCPLGHLFMYGSVTISEAQKISIRAGVCPVRVNGTFGFSPGRGLEDMDLSEVAPSAAGDAVVSAIDAYIKRYGSTT